MNQGRDLQGFIKKSLFLYFMDILVHHYLAAKDVVKEDVIELVGKKKVQSFDKFSIVKDISIQELSTLSFLLQSAIQIGVLLSNAKYSSDIESSFPALTKSIDKKSLELFSKDAKSFAIRSIKDCDLAIPSPDISCLVGDWFSTLISDDIDVQLKNPDLPILALVTDDQIIISVDVIGFLLSKRPYKISLHSGAINGVLAHTISRLTGVKKDSFVVDPFCGGGTIPIEVASYQEGITAFPFENKFSAFRIPILQSAFEKTSAHILSKVPSKSNRVFGFDNMLKIMMGAQKNAKLSGVFDSLAFSKVDIEWLDSKFDEGAVDIIISNPPQISKRNNNEKQIKKIYDDLFYQGKYLLNKKGVLAVLLIHSSDAIEIALKHGFKEIESIPIHSGGQVYSLVKFKIK